jgi:HKD family nuclease
MKAVETTTNALAKLIEMSKTYSNYDLEICVGYISASGVLNLRPLFDAAKQRRVVAALNVSNSLAAFQLLQEYEAEVYVYPPDGYAIFHPKIYLGTTTNNAWAMVGSSNLTQNGLHRNVEYNLFHEGQRHTEPFVSIEAQVQSFRHQAYVLDTALEAELKKIDKAVWRSRSESDFSARLKALGITPKRQSPLSVPLDAQNAAIKTLMDFARDTYLEYAYQMLLLLVILEHLDENGQLPIKMAIDSFKRFYKHRINSGLSAEKLYRARRARVENDQISDSQMKTVIKEGPFLRFERQGLLDLDESGTYFIVNSALLPGLTPAVKASLRTLAIERMAEHYAEPTANIESMVSRTIG